MRPPNEIILRVAEGTLLVLTGPGGIATATSTIQPFGGIPLGSPDTLWATESVCGWRVPWGRYEVNGQAFAFPAESFTGYMTLYGRGDMAADITGSALVGGLGYGVPDGRVSTDDFLYFIDLFS